jgi:hypothetical protein
MPGALAELQRCGQSDPDGTCLNGVQPSSNLVISRKTQVESFSVPLRDKLILERAMEKALAVISFLPHLGFACSGVETVPLPLQILRMLFG